MTNEELGEVVGGYQEDSYNPKTFVGEAFLGATQAYTSDFLIDVPFVTRQGKQPSCTAHAVTTAKGYLDGARLSPRFNFSWTKYADGYQGWGANFETALDVVVKRGGVLESEYPDLNTLNESDYYNASLIPTELNSKAVVYRAQSYVRYSRTVNEIVQALLTHKSPLLVGSNWYQSYNKIGKDGMIPEMSGSYVGHAFIAVGWRTVKGKWQLICQNSLGEAWGDGGRFYIPEDDLNRLYGSVYGLIDLPVENAKAIDLNYKQSQKKPMMDLQLLKNQGTVLLQDTDTSGTFYINTGKKLLVVGNDRAALAALTVLMLGGKKGLGISQAMIAGLPVEQF